jgi:N6-adenosine-specific RNA methylase IME4
LASQDAHLHLWTTNAFLREALDLIGHWGFEYKGFMLWVKPQMGIGNYWRVSHEFLLLGTKGKCPFLDRGQMSWIQVERSEHSKKPDVFRQTVEKVSPGPRIELFAREVHHGWTCHGNEIKRNLFTASIP